VPDVFRDRCDRDVHHRAVERHQELPRREGQQDKRRPLAGAETAASVVTPASPADYTARKDSVKIGRTYPGRGCPSRPPGFAKPAAMDGTVNAWE
jgi:hypothetical protein